MTDYLRGRYVPGVSLLEDGDFKLAKIEKPGTNTRLPDPPSPEKCEMSPEGGKWESIESQTINPDTSASWHLADGQFMRFRLTRRAAFWYNDCT